MDNQVFNQGMLKLVNKINSFHLSGITFIQDLIWPF